MTEIVRKLQVDQRDTQRRPHPGRAVEFCGASRGASVNSDAANHWSPTPCLPVRLLIHRTQSAHERPSVPPLKDRRNPKNQHHARQLGNCRKTSHIVRASRNTQRRHRAGRSTVHIHCSLGTGRAHSCAKLRITLTTIPFEPTRERTSTHSRRVPIQLIRA